MVASTPLSGDPDERNAYIWPGECAVDVASASLGIDIIR